MQDYLKDGAGAISRLNRSWALQTANDIAHGLLALHSHGVVHGNLRPSNVLIGDGGEVEIVDWGFSSSADRSERLQKTIFAPEEASTGDEVLPPGDVYSFGKVVRLLLKATLDVSQSDKQRLDWVSAQCVRTSPERRPAMTRVVDMLSDSVTDWFDPRATSKTRLAVMADIDARCPGLLEAHPQIVARAVSEASDALVRDVTRYEVYRMASLEHPELIHLISTMAMSEAISHVSWSNSKIGRLRVILSAVEYDQPLEDKDQPEIGDSSSRIDSDWRHQIERNVLGEAAIEDVSVDIREMVETQVLLASELRADILAQDAFIRSEDVAAIMSPACPGITVDEVRILRDLGYLVSMVDQGLNIYPLFQFEPRSGLPYSCVKAVADMMPSGDSLWTRAAWWFLPSERLRGATPAAWLQDNGSEQSVIISYFERFAA